MRPSLGLYLINHLKTHSSAEEGEGCDEGDADNDCEDGGAGDNGDGAKDKGDEDGGCSGNEDDEDDDGAGTR
jgi:hypothetical protein